MSTGIAILRRLAAAAATLAALLLSLGDRDRLSLAVSQGGAIGRPSRLEAEAWRDGAAVRASVGGDCVPVSEGRLLC